MGKSKNSITGVFFSFSYVSFPKVNNIFKSEEVGLEIYMCDLSAYFSFYERTRSSNNTFHSTIASHEDKRLFNLNT